MTAAGGATEEGDCGGRRENIPPPPTRVGDFHGATNWCEPYNIRARWMADHHEACVQTRPEWESSGLGSTIVAGPAPVTKAHTTDE